MVLKTIINLYLHYKKCQPLHRGAFCQFPFRWIYYYGSNESTGKEAGKTHLCALCGNASQCSVMPDLSIEHNRRLFNRSVAWLCHDTLFWEQRSLTNFEFFVPLPHFNGLNGVGYGVSRFWLVLLNILILKLEHMSNLLSK